MSNAPESNRACDITPSQPEPDGVQLTPEQLEFAKVIGKQLAERWAKLHASQSFAKVAENRLP